MLTDGFNRLPTTRFDSNMRLLLKHQLPFLFQSCPSVFLESHTAHCSPSVSHEWCDRCLYHHKPPLDAHKFYKRQWGKKSLQNQCPFNIFPQHTNLERTYLNFCHNKLYLHPAPFPLLKSAGGVNRVEHTAFQICRKHNFIPMGKLPGFHVDLVDQLPGWGHYNNLWLLDLAELTSCHAIHHQLLQDGQ